MLLAGRSRRTRVFVGKPIGEACRLYLLRPGPQLSGAVSVRVDFEPDPGVTDTLRVVDGSRWFWALARYADFIIPYNPSIYELERGLCGLCDQ